ncbi:TetR/AcrR family transcriptional regulator [Microlunatus speluncae]|uniref:TetR/AcrR family transcriptional regulator n=1 Tax=Microlunatus speluncae TaxID=2594267 RepID=UPI0012667AD9|nr:TetR family transcriptional regulator [Microlunatus speluncae]
MPSRKGSARGAGRQATFTEQARRAQLIEVTIELVAAHGYARCSLQRIADAAGITKAAVIYHYASKAAVIKAAYDSVITAMIEHVTERILAAESAEGRVEAYLTAMIDYVARHPTHARMITEAIVESDETGVADRPESPARHQELAQLIAAAKTEGSYRPDLDPTSLAIILGGAVDGIANSALADPTLDLAPATTQLLDLLHHGARNPAT